jgi:intracellular septation protein
MNFFREFAPLVVFFATYKFYGLMEATIVLSIVMTSLLAYDYFIVKKVQMQMVISTLLLLVFGAITVLTGDTSFIKIKVTIINLLFGLTLSIGAYFNKGFVKYIFGPAVNLDDKAWLTLSKRFGAFFMILAILNEIVWRNFSEEFWVNFKTFGVLGVTFIFILTQVSFLAKNQKDAA